MRKRPNGAQGATDHCSTGAVLETSQCPFLASCITFNLKALSQNFAAIRTVAVLPFTLEGSALNDVEVMARIGGGPSLIPISDRDA